MGSIWGCPPGQGWRFGYGSTFTRKIGLPANTFRFKERGQPREGFWADLVIFNPDTVSVQATFDDPHHYGTGIPHVLVNAVLVIKDGEYTGARPGQGLRHRAARVGRSW